MESTIETTTQQIKQAGLIAILRGDYSVNDLLHIGDALLAGTITVMEVTLNSPSALAALPELRARFGKKMLVGAGTVRTASLARKAIEAGAQFMVAPNLDPETVAVAHSQGVLHIPGVFTGTEVQAAFVAGCRILKLFPMADDGPAYLKALRGPFNDVDFIPTGGISLDNIANFVHAGAVAVGLGANLVLNRLQPHEDITARALAMRQAWDSAKEA